MIKKVLFISLIVSLFILVGCVQQKEKQIIDELEPPKTTLHFTLSNERVPDRSVEVLLNGEIVYDGELVFGFGKLKRVSFETTEGTFSFDVTDITTGIKETTTINTENGLFVAVNFWGDSITIDQSTEEKIRID